MQPLTPTGPCETRSQSWSSLWGADISPGPGTCEGGRACTEQRLCAQEASGALWGGTESALAPPPPLTHSFIST